MRSFALFLIIFSLSLSKSLRHLKLERDEEKYKTLVEAAIKTAYQLYELNIDFKNRNTYNFEDKKKKIYIVIDENPVLPTEEKQVGFNITNGEVQIPKLDYPAELKYGLEINIWESLWLRRRV